MNIVIYLKQLAQLCIKEKKCGAHTHVHQLSQLFFIIFTSVVVYSRTTKYLPKHKKNYTVCLREQSLVFVLVSATSSLICTVVQSKKKCGAHTHVHQLSLTSAQYSRRLLSILAQQLPNIT